MFITSLPVLCFFGILRSKSRLTWQLPTGRLRTYKKKQRIQTNYGENKIRNRRRVDGIMDSSFLVTSTPITFNWHVDENEKKRGGSKRNNQQFKSYHIKRRYSSIQQRFNKILIRFAYRDIVDGYNLVIFSKNIIQQSNGNADQKLYGCLYIEKTAVLSKVTKRRKVTLINTWCSWRFQKPCRYQWWLYMACH